MPETTGNDYGIPSTKERLLAVQAAIHRLVSKRVSSVQIGRRTVSFLDLEKLMKLERQLKAELAAEQGDDGHLFATDVAYFDGR